ncbi:hypothetical protein T4A_2814 [Trichinella pseudospiralis]|uniref:Uncharacterized protein n=1 Tax=Trichinella pseudospiralis TaxID=6337 RepID=A0A0V1E753_TRIPS|nr:hypothetical protein T4A_2814 [Trichinella pseudospiralis]KRY69154.1 hypothetical protein T4A_2814 [Trichinella pseudospiralis]
MEQSKNENADDMKPITDVTKEEEQERKRGSGSRTTRSGSRTARSRSTEDRRYAVPRGSQFCKSGLGILRKGEVIP